MVKQILFISIDPVIYRRRVLNQIEAALELGWQPSVITTRPELNSKTVYKIHYIKQPFKRGPLRFLYFNYQTFKIILKQKIDVIHPRGLWVLPAVFIATFFKKFKLVYDAHEFFAGHELFQKHIWRRLTWLKLEKLTTKKMDVLLTVSEPLGEHYQNLYPSLKKVEIIRSLPKMNEHILNQPREENKNILLSFHGYFLPGRGLAELLEALAELQSFPFKLNLIGEGPLKNELENKVRALKLAENVQFHPFVESDKLLQKIHKADLGIALIEADSINRANALPNKFFEYIHAAVPVLTSNIPTLKAYVEKYKLGWTADPYNKNDIIENLKYIFENPSILSTYRAHCIKAAKELCWQNESNKLKNIYLGLFK